MPITPNNEEEIKKIIKKYSEKLLTENLDFKIHKVGMIINEYKKIRDKI